LIARAMPIARELDTRYIWMLVRGNAGVAALATGDIDAAETEFREELRVGRELGVVSFATEGLEGLAAVAAHRDALDRAARLYGAALASRYGKPTSYAIEERLRRTFLIPARARFGEDAWDALVHEGAALGHDEAVDYALAASP
jgi:hypothetical protein